MQIRAAVMHEVGRPLTIETISIDEPMADEVLVRTVASGVCHSHVHVYEGLVNAGRPPIVLGHEGAGVVEAVGARWLISPSEITSSPACRDSAAGASSA